MCSALPSREQVGAACSPSTGTARPTTRGRTAGTWWPPCRRAGPGSAWPPSGTSCTPWEGKEEGRGTSGGCHHLRTEPSVLPALEEAGVVTGIVALSFSSARPASHTSSVVVFLFVCWFIFPYTATTGPRIWPRWSPTTPSPTPGSPRCPWAPGGAAWA